MTLTSHYWYFVKNVSGSFLPGFQVMAGITSTFKYDKQQTGGYKQPHPHEDLPQIILGGLAKSLLRQSTVSLQHYQHIRAIYSQENELTSEGRVLCMHITYDRSIYICML